MGWSLDVILSSYWTAKCSKIGDLTAIDKVSSPRYHGAWGESDIVSKNIGSVSFTVARRFSSDKVCG